MKKIFILSMMWMLGVVYSFAQENSGYRKVLYRINTGGWYITSIDTTNKGWLQDDSYAACAYVDINVVGNKTFGVYDAITLDASVPTSTPGDMFKTERNLSMAGQDRLQYDFPIAAGQEVEVRLFFSENYYNAPKERLMDVYVEGVKKISNFDVYSEVGKFVGLMKSYTLTVYDGNLDIDIKEVKKLAMINGIEIIALSEVTIQNVFAGNYKTPSVSVFPNPCTNEITIDNSKLNIESIKLLDVYGKDVSISKSSLTSNIVVDMKDNPKGIYYLKVISKDENIETIKILKD